MLRVDVNGEDMFVFYNRFRFDVVESSSDYECCILSLEEKQWCL